MTRNPPSVLLLALAVSCSSSTQSGDQSGGGAVASGGSAQSSGGRQGAGGAQSSSGSPGSGGWVGLGGSTATGGSPAVGTSAAGGLSGSAGSTAMTAAGGAVGGRPATGGTGAGGSSGGTGGFIGSGGSLASGGVASGGNRATTGGADSTGGKSGIGGTGGGVTNGCSSSAPGGYYIDSVAGNDTADGSTPATAWKSLSKVNGVMVQPGGRICLKAGSSWTGQLRPKGSGSSEAPIVVDQYGTGAKPAISAGTSDAEAVSLVDQQYWEFNNLDISNKKASLGDYRGIAIHGQSGGTLNHIVIRNCRVHDVTGEVNWIGGDVADNATGVTFDTGWDASKKTGGIVFDVLASSGSSVKTRFNDVLIEGNTVQDCSFGGIIFKQLDGTVHWGTRSSTSSTTWFPHTNVTVRNNYISQLNTSYGCNAIYMTNVQKGLIERNVCNGAGTSAIELYYTDSVTIQKNETFATKRKAGGADWNGIDTDKATTKSIIQYNYVHDNGDGILLCQFVFGDSIVRYNILQNNSRYQIYMHSDKAASSAIYNNTVYNGKSNSGVVYGYGDSLLSTYSFKNNIFFAAAGNGVLTTAATISYLNNVYFGSSIQRPSGDAAAMTADPKLAAPGTGTAGSADGPAFTSLDGYKLQSGSPAINTGVDITGNGGTDFWGGTIVGKPDVGAFESR